MLFRSALIELPNIFLLLTRLSFVISLGNFKFNNLLITLSIFPSKGINGLLKTMAIIALARSEERRVGKECRSGWWT